MEKVQAARAGTNDDQTGTAVGGTPVPSTGSGLGRIPVIDTSPSVDGGRWAAKAVVGEAVPVRATVFREGHDAVSASAVLLRPDGSVRTRVTMTPMGPGTDRWEAWVVPDAAGDWTFRVEGWSDPYGTWDHDATIKVRAGVDVELMLVEGALLLERAADRPELPEHAVHVLHGAAWALRDTGRPAEARLAAGTAPEVAAVLAEHPLRDMVSPGPEMGLRVERERALVGAWYEVFPRSEGAWRDESGAWRSGTLRTATAAVDRAKSMGFDVLYLTPIHPIGSTNRKGRNNTLTTEPGDPGSPYGIGSEAGGHDAIHPDLGTFDDFDHFVGYAREQGLEVAMDIALQASPDHPWVREHPEWFVRRSDGSIAYAENPPKKYQDIYPVNFDDDPAGIYAEVLRIVLLWASHGVKLFRVDNPHTKSVVFWEWLIEKVREVDPDVLFLSEAFTKPSMMRALAKVGFAQSYTYYAWRNTREELTDYLLELTTGGDEPGEGDAAHGGTADYLRPSFWPTTHDILTPYMQYGGPAAHALRAVIAATSVPTYGIYTGYELVENVARPGAEEHVDNEKYEYKQRDWDGAAASGRSLAPLLAKLNWARHHHPALQRLRGLSFHTADDDSVLAYSRRVPAEQSPTGAEDVVLVIVNLDPHSTRETTVHLDMTALGLQPWESFTATDLVSGDSWTWWENTYVKLGPATTPFHVVHVTRSAPGSDDEGAGA